MAATTTTKDQILDTAERLFAERGYEGTSLRAVTGGAEVNLAAVNYHFGTKLRLYAAVFERRMEGINRERIVELDTVEAASGGRQELEPVLRAFLEPPLRRLGAPDEGERLFLRIVARLQWESGEHVETLQDVFGEVRRRFFPAFQACLPHLEPAELLWRVHLLIGTLCSVLAAPERIFLLSEGLCDPKDTERTVHEVVAFALGALGHDAPVRGGAEGRGARKAHGERTR